MIRDLDLRRVHRDGSPIDVSTSAAPIRDSRGEVVAIIASMVDVTARKRSERALAASEGRKDAVLRASLDCIVIVDHEGLIIEVNPATEETLGWARNDVLGKPFLELAVAAEAPGRPGRRVRERQRAAARVAPRDHRPPLRLPHVLGRGRDHARRRPRPDALRRLAPRRHEAPGSRRAAPRGRGEVPHAGRADPARDVHQLGRPAGADDLHEPADRGDVRLPGQRLAEARLPGDTRASRRPRARVRRGGAHAHGPARTSGSSTA